MKYSVQLGFGIIIFLILASSGGMLYQTQRANTIVDELVSISNAKIEYAQTMQKVILQREVSLNTMLVMDDIFERDEEILRYSKRVIPYFDARDKLHALPMTEEERLLHEQLQQHTRATHPISERVTELIRAEAPREEIIEALNVARIQRAPIYVKLDELVSLQKRYGQDALEKSRELYNETLWAIIFIGALVIALSFAIAAFVSHIVAAKNKQLLDKNSELEIAYEHAESATKSKSAFLANMSHEIRTPITAIIGFAESSLLSGQTMEMRQKALKTIISSGKHLLHIINDVLDLSKIEAKKLEIENLSTSLIELMKEVEIITKPLAEEKGLEFEVHYHCPLPKKINTDPLRLKQVVLNLCSNAIKFTENGHVYLDVRFEEKANEIAIEVVDSGIGLDKQQIDRIFEPFNQAEASTSRRYGGTGLGLPISNDLIKALGGRLEVNSILGEGSSFRVSLDVGEINSVGFVEDIEKIEAEQSETCSPLETESLSGKVLVVEDNAVNQQLLTLFLEKLNVDIVMVENGQLAIEKLQEEEFDLVLMDIQMPVMDGVEATTILRERNYNKPIIALTANVMTEDVETYMAVGFDGYLSKPIEIEKFFEVISSYLNSGSNKDQLSDEPIKSEVIEEDSRLLSVAVTYVQHSLPDMIRTIEGCVEDKTWTELNKILTKAKGTSGSLGYIDLREVILKMEFQVLNKNQSELCLLLAELRNVYKRMAAGLNITLIDSESISERRVSQSGV